MMTPDQAMTDRSDLADRLDDLRARLVRAGSLPDGWLTDLRTSVGDGADDGDPSPGSALRRLVLTAEVWECLAADGPEAVGELPDFIAEALDRLADGLRSGDLDPAAAWLLRVSRENWGEYLSLLDPSVEPGPAPLSPDEMPDDPSTGDDPTTIDLADLLRRMTGAGSIAQPAAEPLVRAEPDPAADCGRVDHPGPVEPGDAPSVDLESEALALALDPEIRGAFAADAADLLARIQELIPGLGGDDDARLLHDLGRCFHTLKGAAGSVGLVGLAAEIHALEDHLEQAGGRASVDLARRLDGSLARFERVLDVLNGAAPSGDASEGRSAGQGGGGDPPPGTRAEGTDGLVRVPADRFEELMDLCSELLTRRRAWAEQAERIKQLAATTKTCSHRLRMSVERLGEAIPRDTLDLSPRHEDLAGLVRRMTEQAEDLAALASTAREAALPVAEEAETLSRLSQRLWESLQSVRVVPVLGLFRRLARVAADAARVEDREIEVVLLGEETGADRLLLDKAYEPLLHVVRNAVGHGVEPPEDRRRAGKAPAGRITLEARREGNTLAIAVQDDGRGLDYDAIAEKGRRLGLIADDERPGADRLNALIFQPGFSTRGLANAISGRGVGMDVVAQEVERLRGRVELASRTGQGTRLAIRLPARLSLEHVMVVRVGGQAFAVPTSSIDSVQRDETGDSGTGSDRPTVTVGDHRRTVADLGTILGIPAPVQRPCPTLLVVGADGDEVALRVDGIDGPLELIVRPLGPLLAGHPAISGAGLTTGGEIVLAVDVAGVLRLARGGASASLPLESKDRPRALVVDDSLSVRRVASRNLRTLGFDVDEASDGEQALGKLRQRSYQLIMTDLEMPRMDGFALLSELGRTGVLKTVPVLVASTLADPATRRRALELGARAYLTKPVAADALADVVGMVQTGDGRPLAGRAGSPR